MVFLGHGEKYSDKFKKKCYNNIDKKKGDILVLETLNSQDHLVPMDDLKKILKDETNTNIPDLVVVASCHSEEQGQIFIDAGVKHVICVKRDFNVRLKMYQKFLNKFFYYLYNDKESIC